MIVVTNKLSVVRDAVAAVNAAYGANVLCATGPEVVGRGRVHGGFKIHFTLKTGSRDVFHRRGFGWGGKAGRHVPKLCWHGHFAVMREMFKLDPLAELRTTRTTYHGAQMFARDADATGDAEVGRGQTFREMCDCSEDFAGGAPGDVPETFEREPICA